MANMSLSAYGKYSHSWIRLEDYLSKLSQLSLQVGIKHLQLFLLKVLHQWAYEMNRNVNWTKSKVMELGFLYMFMSSK